MSRPLLLNPGPVTLSRRVREAMLRPDLCHREPEFTALQDRLRDGLLGVYGSPSDEWAAVLLTGSGTVAVEAMLSSCVPVDGRLLVLDNGVYGARMGRIAQAHGIDHAVVRSVLGEPIDLAGADRALRDGRFTHVAVVHHETTTGRLNDLPAVGALAARHGARLLVDAVSSFGAEWIDADGWAVDACAGTGGKCLHGVPGAAFVVARRRRLAAGAVRTVYLDLADHLAHQDAGTTAFTPSVPAFHALDEALDEFTEDGGWRARRDLFRRRMARVRAAVLSRGVEPLLDEADCSCVLHAFVLPRGVSYDGFHDALKSEGIIVYGGQGPLAGEIFRLSAMGDLTERDVGRIVDGVPRALGDERPHLAESRECSR